MEHSPYNTMVGVSFHLTKWSPEAYAIFDPIVLYGECFISFDKMVAPVF
jgi:hypothetical protein